MCVAGAISVCTELLGGRHRALSAAALALPVPEAVATGEQGVLCTCKTNPIKAVSLLRRWL